MNSPNITERNALTPLNLVAAYTSKSAFWSATFSTLVFSVILLSNIFSNTALDAFGKHSVTIGLLGLAMSVNVQICAGILIILLKPAREKGAQALRASEDDLRGAQQTADPDDDLIFWEWGRIVRLPDISDEAAIDAYYVESNLPQPKRLREISEDESDSSDEIAQTTLDQDITIEEGLIQ